MILEENPQIFRQKTAPGPSSILSDGQPSISSGVKPPQTSDCFDFPDFQPMFSVIENTCSRGDESKQTPLYTFTKDGELQVTSGDFYKIKKEYINKVL